MKKNLKNLFIFGFILIAAGAAAFWWHRHQAVAPVVSTYQSQTPDQVSATHALLNVAFTPQAPTGNWSDPREEDGCEEASVYMAWLWIHDQGTNPQTAEQTILDMANFEQAQYGNYHDFDAADTAKFMEDYYKYPATKISVVDNPTIQDIKNSLAKGELVLAPTNGQRLDNPHYKQPGPTTHMLVVKGFDDATSQFTTNDPGTRFGENYKYSYNTLFNAMVDYPSGDHESQVGRGKALIVISK